jgi:hypothetical protein
MRQFFRPNLNGDRGGIEASWFETPREESAAPHHEGFAVAFKMNPSPEEHRASHAS